MILVAGVGYSHLSDLSFGPKFIERVQNMDWPDEVQIEDLSFGPIAVVQWFQDHPGKFSRAIFAGAMDRDRPPAMLTIYDWDGSGYSRDVIQERVGEAVTGVVSLENLLIVAGHFGVLPARTMVIEFEPVDMEWGLDLSPFGERRLEEALSWVQNEILATGNPAERR
jgi:hydrogenase maturation protease